MKPSKKQSVGVGAKDTKGHAPPAEPVNVDETRFRGI